MTMDISTQLLSATVPLLQLVVIAVAAYLGRIVWRDLKQTFGGGKLQELLDCLHLIAHQMESHIKDAAVHHSHLGDRDKL